MAHQNTQARRSAEDLELYQKSEAKTKSDFVRARLLGEAFKVIKENPSAEPCIERLTKIVALTHKIGILYDEAVKVLNTYHSVATAQRMISKLETYSQALIRLQEQALQLTKDFERRMNRKLTNQRLPGSYGLELKENNGKVEGKIFIFYFRLVFPAG